MTQEGLSPHDIDNFKNKVPLVYKYRDPFTVEGAGAGGGKSSGGGKSTPPKGGVR
jgi:hypothetical protein